MKIPKNMTESEVIDKINLVVNRIAPKYTFAGYETDDIKQEAFMICMDALERYDQKRPLENFLSVHLSNRLKNFIRDNYCYSNNDEKKKVLCPKQLSYEDKVLDIDTEVHSDNIDAKDIKKIIDDNLPMEHRADYLKIINNVYVPKRKKELILNIIKDILKDYKYA